MVEWLCGTAIDESHGKNADADLSPDDDGRRSARSGGMEGYSGCQLQPDSGFSDDNNDLLNAVAEEYHCDSDKKQKRSLTLR